MAASSAGWGALAWPQDFGGTTVIWAAMRTPAGMTAKVPLSERNFEYFDWLSSSVNDSGDGLVVWASSATLRASIYKDGAGWAPAELVDSNVWADPSGANVGADCVIGNDGTPFVAYVLNDSSGNPRLYVKTRTTSWGAGEILDSGHPGVYPLVGALGHSSDGHIQLAWIESDPSLPYPANRTIWMRDRAPDGSWSLPTQVSGPMCVEPASVQVVGDQGGDRLLAWIGGPDNRSPP